MYLVLLMFYIGSKELSVIGLNRESRFKFRKVSFVQKWTEMI